MNKKKDPLSITINGVNFKNPIIAASGTFGFGKEYNELYDVGILGGISSKGLTIKPKEGNKGVRIYETASGIMNSVGLQNPGVVKFIEDELPWMKATGSVVLANLGGGCLEDYLQGIDLLNDTDVDIVELNISCPNVKSGGMAFGVKADVAYETVSIVKEKSRKPLMVKLSPNAENIIEMALACEEAGADSLSLVNTFKGLAIDIKRRKPIFDNLYAGLSGASIKPIALRMVHEVCKNVKIPVVGLGGIYTVEDVIEFIMAGATAVQIGTANFTNPLICKNIIDELPKFMEREGIKSLEEVRGII
ncbi:dihydroorotate dehydrogenase [Bacteroidales bacterium OttesenSCG-928-B11]|nr:dihydroorotate dehydrogenase [Bacteroidales bacterium OttesenSCG-928-E04]MDL2313099.1 dihydroorotate dehydrogenase [Bacteroidales bacterium OttesenSCG-928-B11]MDL2326560.1 dihydroorotate dehydrogenase [Bacteroidales bacterium OttesenSCG-928-A14]